MKQRPCTHRKAANVAEAVLLRAIPPACSINRTAYIPAADTAARNGAFRRRGSFAGRGVLRLGGVTLPCEYRRHSDDK